MPGFSVFSQAAQRGASWKLRAALARQLAHQILERRRSVGWLRALLPRMAASLRLQRRQDSPMYAVRVLLCDRSSRCAALRYIGWAMRLSCQH